MADMNSENNEQEEQPVEFLRERDILGFEKPTADKRQEEIIILEETKIAKQNPTSIITNNPKIYSKKTIQVFAIEAKLYYPPKLEKVEISLLLLFLMILFFTITVLTKPIFFYIGLLPFTFFLEWFYSSRFNPDKYLRGSITLTDEYIEINNQRFVLKEIRNLKVEINEYDGQIEIVTYTRRDYILNGTNNKISFEFLGLKIKYNFYISNTQVLNDFKVLYNNWYKEKINFIETTKVGRTYGMEYLNYQQIQDFKRKYEFT